MLVWSGASDPEEDLFWEQFPDFSVGVNALTNCYPLESPGRKLCSNVAMHVRSPDRSSSRTPSNDDS